MERTDAAQAIFLVDSIPLPVCKRVRARGNRKVRGRAFCGYCAAKQEKFFGWRLHLVCTAEGIPVTFDLLPAAEHDLTPIHELLTVLPTGARVFGDKGYIASDDQASLHTHGTTLIAMPRKNMRPLGWADEYDLRTYRKQIETVNSQLDAMAVTRLKARTQQGFELKVHASLLALTFTNLFQ